MKKIAKFTWLNNGNYGSILQAFALQKFLQARGFEVIDFNYSAVIRVKMMNWLINRNSPKLFYDKYKDSRGQRTYTHQSLFEERNRRFNEFKRQNMNITKLYTNPKQIKKAAKDFEIFICGSDQIWSPALMNPIYYLELSPAEGVRIAYAPSFGVMKTSKTKEKKIARYLNKFNYISIRENEGREFIKNITGLDVPVQVDPTMLLNKDEWRQYTGKRIETDNYIFCYLLSPNQKYIEAIRKISNEKNLKVIIVPSSKGPFNTGFDERISTGPVEWLNYIENASIIFTDSYHGCIFSSLFEKEFILFKRFTDSDIRSENSRVYTLTKLLAIEDRLIDENKLAMINKLKDIDFENVKRIIDDKAKESGDWLLNILKKVC